MFDYILFHEKPFNLFIDWLATKKIVVETKVENESYQIKVADDLDESLLDEIDEKYDEFMEMNQKLVDEEEKNDSDGYHMAGILVTLKDGTISHADIEPTLLAKILSAMSSEEFGLIVNAIADAVENPQAKSYCQRVREAKG